MSATMNTFTQLDAQLALLILNPKKKSIGADTAERTSLSGPSATPSSAASSETLCSENDTPQSGSGTTLPDRTQVDFSPDAPISEGQNGNYVIHTLLDEWQPQLTKSYRPSAQKNWLSARENLTLIREYASLRGLGDNPSENKKKSGANIKSKEKSPKKANASKGKLANASSPKVHRGHSSAAH